MGKKRTAGISRVTVSHIQGGREVRSVTLTGEEFSRAATLASVESAVVAVMERHNGPSTVQAGGPHVVAREIAVAGHMVKDRHNERYVVVSRSTDGATLYARGGPGNRLHTIRVSDGRAQCIEVR